MKPNELTRLFPKASHAFIKANLGEDSVERVEVAKPQCDPGHGPLAKSEIPEGVSVPVRLCITQFRSRIVDPDNIYVKGLIDCLRYGGIIRDDTAQDITLTVSQTKVPKDQERVEIILEFL